MTKHSYDKEFKEQAVQYYLDNKDHMTMNEISKNLGIGASTLHKWIKLFTETGEFGRGSGNFTSDKDKEIARLKRQLRDAEGAIEVLKKINRDSEQVTTEKVYQEMDVQHALESHSSINGMCDYVGISRSGYYQREKRHNHQSPRKLRKKFIQGEIKAIWLKSLCIYGAGKITQELRSKGYKIAERTVGKYMRELGIHAVYLTPWTTTTRNSKFDKQLINILDEQFNPLRPNAVWCIDTTYIPVHDGFVYLTSIMDLYSRRIIGWDLSETLEVSNVIPLIEKTKHSRHISKPLIMHSDRGSQFTSEAYNQVTANMTLSYSKKAYPWDNACIESFHALIKREWINRFKIHSYSEAKRLVFQYIETFYNTVRIHSHCGFKSPKQLEDEYQTQIQNLVVA